MKNYQAGPTYYSVSQQLVYRVGNTRPRTLAALTAEQLTIAPGHVAINDLQTLKAEKYPDLASARGRKTRYHGADAGGD